MIGAAGARGGWYGFVTVIYFGVLIGISGWSIYELLQRLG